MKRSLNELKGYRIETKDGLKGKVKDFLFDGKRWIIRYLDADLSTTLSDRKRVLVPGMFLKSPDWNNYVFPVGLTNQEIENCPPLDSNLPVSRKYEQELSKYYDVEHYWSNPTMVPLGPNAMSFPPRPISVPDHITGEDEIKTSLRSFNEVKGYHIQAIDGKIGHIDDIIFDDLDWQIVYAVVDTSNWLPWSKKVLIGTMWMDSISYKNQQINVDLHVDSIKTAPEFNSLKPVNEVYERQLYDFYGRMAAH